MHLHAHPNIHAHAHPHAHAHRVHGALFPSDGPALDGTVIDEARPDRAASLVSLMQEAYARAPLEWSLLLVATTACVLALALSNFCARRAAAAHAGGSAAAHASSREEASYVRLRNRYLACYAFAVFGDWLQGGYIYALYEAHGYEMQEIAWLFVIGYGSAATLGTYSSAVGDVAGHRRNCVAYGLLYSLSCLLNNSDDLSMLALSRLLGGISYSILFTNFESWLIAEADASALPPKILTRLFGLATFCNALSAVVAGVVGHVAVEMLPQTTQNKYTAPFNIAVGALLLASLLSATQWTERYGDRQGSAAASLLKSWRTIRGSRTLLTLGLVNALYETALYVFVFVWTPSLERRSPRPLSHGLVFSLFMLCKMVGSQGFSLVSHAVPPRVCLTVVFSGSAIAMAVPLVTSSYEALLFAFCGFECLLGVYWPAIALLRAAEISDGQRSSMMAVFRVLLNALVIGVLLLVGALSEPFIFALAAAMLALCLCATSVFYLPSDAMGGRTNSSLAAFLRVGADGVTDGATDGCDSPRESKSSQRRPLVSAESMDDSVNDSVNDSDCEKLCTASPINASTSSKSNATLTCRA